jgi:hypothetical protein
MYNHWESLPFTFSFPANHGVHGAFNQPFISVVIILPPPFTTSRVFTHLIIFDNTSQLGHALVFLLLILLLFLIEPKISHRWSGFFTIYLLLQTALVFLLLALPGFSDFFAAFLSVLSMQVMLNLNPRLGSAWMALCTLGMLVHLPFNWYLRSHSHPDLHRCKCLSRFICP